MYGNKLFHQKPKYQSLNTLQNYIVTNYQKLMYGNK